MLSLPPFLFITLFLYHFRNLYVKKVAELTNKNEEWLKRVKRKQYEYFEASTLLKSKLILYINQNDKNIETLLKKRIGYVLFGPPSLHQDKYSNLKDLINFVCNSNEKEELAYLDSQKEKIKSIYDKAVELSKKNSVYISCTFIIYSITEKDVDDKDIQVPIFTIQDVAGKSCSFLDSNARVYENWTDCVTSNVLPSATYCYPCNIIYDKSVGFKVAFENAPAKTISSRLMDFAVDAAGVLVQIVSTPMVQGAAIVGANLAKAYMWVKGYKMSVKPSERVHLVTNLFSVARKRAGAVAGSFFTAVTGLSLDVVDVEVVTIICSSDERTAITSLLNNIFEHSLKVLYYFNAFSVENAVQIIQDELEIEEETSMPKLLETLLENNCVNSSKEVVGEIVIGKYVSQNVKDIIFNLLKTNSKTVNIILKQLHIDNSLTIKHNLNSGPFVCIFDEFVKENQYIKENLINKTEFLSSSNDLHLVLAARYLLCSDISKVRMANMKESNFNHKACEKLVGYDCDFHPLDEVVRLIPNMIDQNKSVMDLSQYDNGSYEVLYKLMDTCSHLTANEMAPYVGSAINTSKDICRIFDIELEGVESFMSQNDAKSDNFKEILKTVDVNGKFGIKMLYQIMNIFMNVQNAQISNRKTSNITIVPAWSGVLDRLYMYYSDDQLSDKICLIKDFKGYKEENKYDEHRIDQHSFSLISDDESLPWFVIYAPYNKEMKGECGLIWHSEEEKINCKH